MADAGVPPEEVDASALVRVLGEVQRRGAIGRGPVEIAIAHARQYITALPSEPGLLVDLGSGGGLPGVVIAAGAPRWRVVLIERREKRVDLLRYAVRSLGLADRTEVIAGDAAAVAMRPGLHGQASVVTARSFAPPLTVLSTAVPFLRSSGLVVISEPPDGAVRWSEDDLSRVGFVDDGTVGSLRRFRRH